MNLESRWIKVGDINTHYLVCGEGSPVVLIHGGGAGAEHEWGPNLKPLAEHYRVYAPDLIGYGKTDRPKIQYTTQLFTGFFENFIVALGLDRISLVGHSLGGGVALAFTLNHPEKVEKLVLVDSAGLTDQPAFLGKLLISFYTLVARLRRNHVYTSLMRGGSKPDIYMDRLEEIKTPTLLVWGEKDGYVPVKAAYEAHRKIKNSSIYVFKSCWHAPQRAKSEEFNTLVLSFLNGSLEYGQIPNPETSSDI